LTTERASAASKCAPHVIEDGKVVKVREEDLRVENACEVAADLAQRDVQAGQYPFVLQVDVDVPCSERVAVRQLPCI